MHYCVFGNNSPPNIAKLTTFARYISHIAAFKIFFVHETNDQQLWNITCPDSKIKKLITLKESFSSLNYWILTLKLFHPYPLLRHTEGVDSGHAYFVYPPELTTNIFYFSDFANFRSGFHLFFSALAPSTAYGIVKNSTLLNIFLILYPPLANHSKLQRVLLHCFKETINHPDNKHYSNKEIYSLHQQKFRQFFCKKCCESLDFEKKIRNFKCTLNLQDLVTMRSYKCVLSVCMHIKYLSTINKTQSPYPYFSFFQTNCESKTLLVRRVAFIICIFLLKYRISMTCRKPRAGHFNSIFKVFHIFILNLMLWLCDAEKG
ncbi:hypothetical protein EGR_08729 [Echinococcus granulosus]|uniref:Uncharacterized protein n=1 Tax=Echinococcus granulosus TaxID=6210 RepID=W6U5J9_ECHGR|nr:hypothetical protein EGR_08729 [Echinococcus granulosus]EUB56415.1 hypothetical protein EGR_08729 [Echinococcus granulosus]